MPIYEYKCLRCGLTEERAGDVFSHPQKIQCPTCGTTSEKIISNTSFNAYALEYQRTGKVSQ